VSPIPVGFKWSSGKAALLGSFADYLRTQITDEYFDYDSPLVPVKLPGYGITEKGLFNKAVVAFEHFLGYKNGQPLYGRQDQTLVEISAWDDETTHSDAVGKVRQMRDKVVYVLYNAGRVNDAGGFVLPPIKLYNYNVSPKVEMGVIQVDQADNAINERFIIDPINQNLKTYRILVRLFWYEYL